MPHHILTSSGNLVPNVETDGERSEVVAKAIKNHWRVIPKISGVTALRIENLVKNVVQHVVVQLQPNCLAINLVTIQIHILILRHGKGVDFINLHFLAISTTKAKKMREGDCINLVVLALGGPMDRAIGDVKVVGSIKLTNDLIVPWLCGNLSTCQAPSSVNHEPVAEAPGRETNLHWKDRRLLLLGIPAIDKVVIKVKVEGMPEVILNPQILGLFIKVLGRFFPEPRHIVTVVNL